MKDLPEIKPKLLAEITSDEEWNEVLNKLIEKVAKNETNK